MAASSDYSTGAGKCVALHAERNAVMFVDEQYRTGCTVYVTDEPCPNCREFLTDSGVARVVWPDGEITYHP